MESDNDSDIGDILDDLLANANDTNKSEPAKKLEELNYNFLDSEGNIKETGSKLDKNESSVVHDQDVDSSDDEDKKNFEEQKYSDYGRNLKNILKTENLSKSMKKFSKTQEKSPTIVGNSSQIVDQVSKNFVKRSNDLNDVQKKIMPQSGLAKPKDVYSDPIFGLRLVKPLISSAELVERMKGRKAVTISKVKHHLSSESSQDDWVLAGVLMNRSATKKSQKGTNYCIWKLTDLGDQMNAVSVFLFSGAYKLFWKTATGVAVAILNPGVMDSKDSTDQATLSVDNAQKIMILGNSRDMGKCKSTKKNGEPCSNVVNISQCEYCVYHVKLEYKKASKRTDIQSNGTSNGFASAMAKKAKTPLPGMYSQNIINQNFTPILAKRNEKLHAKDSARLALLRGAAVDAKLPEKPVNTESKKKAFPVEMTSNQLKKDLERLGKLRAWNVAQPTIVASPLETSSFVSGTKKSPQLSISSLSTNSPVPRLGIGAQGGKIDFSQPITKRHVDKARQNALRWIKENGMVKQSNPNKILESRDKKVNAGVKRQRESNEDELEESEKKSKKAPISDKFMELMQAKSSHVDLVEKSEEEEKDKYFNKLEVKERMEEKMMSTFKIECKAVKCLICKYTAYSGSDLCKEQKHPLKVVNAMKSFFKCHDCGNRTTTLDRIPTHSCTKCQSSRWVKAAMMAEKNTSIPSAVLSIRGGEEKFIGSTSQDANINLLVPDSGTADS
ncbi:protein MCM10 homolog [Venturia canescens]|uniref:protein MCM10 homolog n=1 Tax=Venturia canescens TaxID=32260 RepID=UPI001C9D59FD|nr:protein MCM10 homolog [Venturia canescens]